jgi:hypothetical protein
MVAAPRRAWHAACAPSAFHTSPTWCPAVARMSCGRRSTANHSSCSSHRVWDDARKGWRQPRIKRAGLARVPPLQRAGARRQQPHSAPHSGCKGLHSSSACCAPVARTRNRSQARRAGWLCTREACPSGRTRSPGRKPEQIQRRAAGAGHAPSQGTPKPRFAPHPWAQRPCARAQRRSGT